MQNCKDSKEVELKRLFFALEIEAPWPDNFPNGRLLKKTDRHLTVAFLGQLPFSFLKEQLKDFPQPPCQMSLAGICNDLLFLPEKEPRVVAAHVEWLSRIEFSSYFNQIQHWLYFHKLPVENRSFLSHVTIARSPFIPEEWKKSFIPFPIIARAIHLYETVNSLKYRSLWHLDMTCPFEEIEHTADIAFIIRGKTFQDLFKHAQIALSFNCIDFIYYFSDELVENLDKIIMKLNEKIARMDSEMGCSFKAISFHSKLTKDSNDLLQWEMIVDV